MNSLIVVNVCVELNFLIYFLILNSNFMILLEKNYIKIIIGLSMFYLMRDIGKIFKNSRFASLLYLR